MEMEETAFTESLIDYWEKQQEIAYEEYKIFLATTNIESEEDYNERINAYIESHIEDA